MLIHWYRLSHWLWKHNVPVLPKLFWRLQYLLFNCSVPASCTLKEGVTFAYGGIGVVIHARCVVGRHCLIGQNVTIGGKSGWYEVPIIGDNVEICAGARILGPIRIGNNVIIGANAVVVKDVPDNCIVAGVPAHIIKEDMTAEDRAEMTKYKERGDAPFPMTPKI